MDKKKQSAIDVVMTRAADFKDRPFNVANEMDVKEVEPVIFGGGAIFPEKMRLDEIRIHLKEQSPGTHFDNEEELLRELAELELKAEERAKKRQVTFRTSTSGIDRHGTRIRTEGIDLTNYERNPIFAWGHDAYGSWFGPPAMESIIGKSVAIRKGLSQMEQDIEFTPEAINPKGEMAYQMVTNNFLNATSIGFIPKQVIVEMEDEKHIPVITKAELLEASLVPLPSNPEALAIVRQMAKADQLTLGVRGISLQWGCSRGHSHKTVEEALTCQAAEEAAPIQDARIGDLRSALARTLRTNEIRSALRRVIG